MLGTILEEEWMEEELMALGARQNEKHYERRKKPKGWQHKKEKQKHGGKGGGGERVGKMVDWWMGRGGQWPEEDGDEHAENDRQKQQQMVTLAKTTIELSPSRERDERALKHGIERGKKQNLNKSNGNDSWTTPTPFSPLGKSITTIPLQQRHSLIPSAAIGQNLADQQTKSESRGNEVSVSLQVVREHNVTISASCCFGAAPKKFPPLFATTTREMPKNLPLSSIRQNGKAMNDRAAPMVKRLELRVVDIELDEGDGDEGLMEEKCKWRRNECQNECRQTVKKDYGEEDEDGAARTAATQPKQTTGWAQFKKNREEQQQREEREDNALLLLRRHHHHSSPKSSSFSSPTFPFSPHFSSSSASKSANSALPFLSPLCSPQQQTPSPSLPPPSWLNISNGSSSGVGSSVSSVSPKSTDGEGEKDNSSSHLTNRKNNKMEQYQQHFRHTMPRSDRNNCTSADYRVISLDMRPEPGRLEDFVPEVERKANSRTAAEGDIISNSSNKTKKSPPSEKYDVFNAKKLIREERNYDLQSVDCWRRWSSLRKMPTANGTKGAGTLPKREGKRTEEGDNGDEEGLRRDEQGRIIVDRREWRQFLAEQRTPSSRRVENRIRLLHTCADGNHQNNNETDDEFEQYGKNRTRSKKPMFIVVDDDRRAVDDEEKDELGGENAHGKGGTTTLLRTKIGERMGGGTFWWSK